RELGPEGEGEEEVAPRHDKGPLPPIPHGLLLQSGREEQGPEHRHEEAAPVLRRARERSHKGVAEVGRGVKMPVITAAIPGTGRQNARIADI
ncbi:hypothetical protein A4X09_0g1532, partial [Tilletia walkeri]